MSEQKETPGTEAVESVDPWAASEAEALEDFGGDEVVIEEETEAEESGEEFVSDESDEEPAEVEATEEPSDDEDNVEEPQATQPWDGRPETLPEELKPTHQAMVQGMNKKFMELAEIRKEYEAKLEALSAPKEEAAPEGPPPLPDESVSAEEWNKAVDARNRWFAREAVREEAEAKNKIVQEQQTVAQKEAEAKARFESLTSSPDFTDEIAQAMADVAQNDPYWAEQLRTSFEGTNALFKLVKYELDARTSANNKAQDATKADEAIRAKHSAGKRSVSRPKSAASSAGETYALKGFEAAEAAARAEFEKLQ